jgi:nucleoid DNA-binding protein
MRKTELTRRLARRSGVTKAEAADQLDRVVNQIVSNLRKGCVTTLPGLGQFRPGKTVEFEFEKEPLKND